MFVLPETPQELADMGFGYEPLEGVYTFHIQSTPTYRAEQGTVLFIVSPVITVGPHPQEIGKKCRDFRIPLHEDWGRRQLRDLAEACGVAVRVGPNGKAGFEEGDFFNTYFQAEVSYTRKKETDKNGQEVERTYIRYNRLTPAKAPSAGAIPHHQQIQAAPQQQYAPAPQQYAPAPQQYAPAPQQYAPAPQQQYAPAPQGYGPPAQPYQQSLAGYPQGQAPAAAPPGAFVPQQAAPAPTGGFVPPPAFGPPQGAPPQNGAPMAPRGGRDIPSGDA